MYLKVLSFPETSFPSYFVFRITDESVSSFLLPSGRKLWKERANKKWLVLVDEQEASESNSPIMALRDALIKVHMLYMCAWV